MNGYSVPPNMMNPQMTMQQNILMHFNAFSNTNIPNNMNNNFFPNNNNKFIQANFNQMQYNNLNPNNFNNNANFNRMNSNNFANNLNYNNNLAYNNFNNGNVNGNYNNINPNIFNNGNGNFNNMNPNIFNNGNGNLNNMNPNIYNNGNGNFNNMNQNNFNNGNNSFNNMNQNNFNNGNNSFNNMNGFNSVNNINNQNILSGQDYRFVHHDNCKQLQPVLPKLDHEVYLNDSENNANTYYINDNKKINIVFQSNTGLKANLKVSPYITLEQMFKLFINKLGISENYIGKEIAFLFGGKLMNPFSTNLVGHELQDGMFITVFDQNGVIGA